jgi:hypothetical protein
MGVEKQRKKSRRREEDGRVKGWIEKGEGLKRKSKGLDWRRRE